MKAFKKDEKIRLISLGQVGWEVREGWGPETTLTLNDIYTVEGIRESANFRDEVPLDVVDIMNDEGNIRGYHVSHFRSLLMSNEERMALRNKELEGAH